jgi:polysaccharide biosynthesis protein PslE
MSDPQRSTYDLLYFRDVIQRHKQIIIWTPIVVLLFGAIVFLFAPRTYRSEARVFLRVGRETVGLDPTVGAGQTMSLQQNDRKDEVKSALEVIKSRSIVGQAVDKLGAGVVLGRDASKGIGIGDIVKFPLHLVISLIKSIDPISEREEAIVRVERHLYVSAERESTVIVVEYDADNPKLAQTVCDAVVDAYQHEHMRIHRSEESRPFFAEQQERLRAQLDDALESVRAVKNELGISSIEQRRSSLETQFNAVELDRLTTEQQLATAEARVVDLQRGLTEVPERLVDSKRSVPNQGADLLRQQLYALQVKAMDLEARYNDDHPLVKAAKEQLNEAKRVVEKQANERMETTDNINSIHRDLSLELKREQSLVAGLKARQKELAQQKESVLAMLRTINDQDLKIDRLTRQATLARDKYMQYSRNLEEARMDKALEAERISNISILQPAVLAEKPISPSKPLVIAATLLLAVAAPFVLVAGSERLGGEHGLSSLNLGALGRGLTKRRVFSKWFNGQPKGEVSAKV